MNATSKTSLMQCFRVLSLTILPIIFCSISNSFEHVLIFIGVILLVHIVLNALPVRCSTWLCTGRMSQTVTRTSFWKERWSYQCDTCDDVFETEIFAPDITVEVSS